MVLSRRVRLEYIVAQSVGWTTRFRFLTETVFLLLVNKIKKLLEQLSIYPKGKTAGA
jgi:hypothetical protein